MKKILLSTIALSTLLTLSAKGIDWQSKVTLQRKALEKAKAKEAVAAGDMTQKMLKAAAEESSILAFVGVAEGYDRDDLEEAGFTVKALRGDVAIVGLPIDKVEEYSSLPCITKLTVQRETKTNMQTARRESGVDAIHQGSASEGLTMPYTGKGVLTTIVDQGVDPNHISFLDADGKSRVKYLTYFDGTADRNGNPNVAYYGDDIYDVDESGNTFYYPKIDKFTTDELGTYHGTHTMNILAGGYKGKVEIAKGLSGRTPVIETVSNPYYGVATDSEIAVSCGSLADACIALGINGLLDYADYRKQADKMPSVVSLSLGATTGPHDPNGLMNRFLAECGKESIVVLAAGNEGDLKIALNKNLTADDNSLASMIYPYAYRYDPSAGQGGTNNTYVRNGAVMVYSNDATPFTLKAFVMTGTEGNYRRRATFDISSQEGEYFLSNNYYANYVGGTVNSTIERYFDGYIGGGSMYDEDLGRYYGVFDYYLYTNPETGFNADGSEAVIVGFEVIGQDGQRIECYGDGMNTWMSNYGMSAYMDGQRDGTISDMAVGDNVLVVGAYTTSTRWTSLNGEDYGYLESDGFVLNDIGQYSSYGTLADGRTLPHVCAPGSCIISAMSQPYVDNYFKGYEQYIPMNFQARTTANGKTYYWKSETGTSMATPFVAGSIALWLEADPTLDVNQVKEIVAKTAVRDEYVEKGNQVQWGAGKFNALAGLKEVIKNSSVKGVNIEENNRLICTPEGYNTFNLFVGGAQTLDIRVFNLAGGLVYSSVIKGCEATVDLSSLSSGIYAVTVNGHSAKIMIK